MARSSTAYDFEYFEGTRNKRIEAAPAYVQKPIVKQSVQAKQKAQQKPKVRIVRTVLIVALFVAGAMLMLYSNVKMNEVDVKINNANAQVSELRSKNKKLDMKLSQTFSSNNIELIATAEFGMIRAQVANVEYFSVPARNIVSVKNQDEGFFSKLLRLF
jgi:hypothetical protein